MKLNAVGKTSETDVIGDVRPAPGWYLAAVKWASEDKVPGKVLVNFEVLGGTTPGQQGRCLEEGFDCDGKHACKLLRLAMAMLSLKTGQPVLPPGSEADVNFAECVGSLVVIEVEPNEFDTKDGKHIVSSRIKYDGTYSPRNPAVANVMTCPEVVAAVNFLNAHGYSVGTGDKLAALARAGNGFGPPTMPQAAPQQTTGFAPPAAPANRYAGI